MAELQDILFAQKKHSLLVILQGMDSSGKDGTVKHIFSGINPQGFIVTSFKKPSLEEEAHDFLWRVHQKTPLRDISLHLTARIMKMYWYHGYTEG